jgi:iron(III) transport system substrate-binding protein
MRVLIRSLAAMGFAAAAASAFAAPSSVAEIAAYEGADRQALLETGARREGVILIYAIGTQADPVYAAFAKKYPFVRVETAKADSPTISRRMIEEYAARTYLVDALDVAVTGLRPLKEAGVLQAYRSPELAQFTKTGLEPSGYWAVDYESYVSLGYNTTLVSDAEAPKTYDDLLDPKWRGRMAVPGTSTLANFIGAIVTDRGEAFARRLSEQKIRVYEVSGRAVANLVVSGEVPLSPALFNSHIANSRDQGAPVAWRALGGVYSTTGAMALAAQAPHPHAAMLFIDFMLSREGQEVYRTLGYASARIDMAGRDKPSKVYYFGDDPNYPQNYEKWLALGRQITGQK